jgi:anti-sigma regulatory factor (Ser/Thr protein kinase)
MRKARRFHCQPASVAGARQFVGDLLRDQPCEIVEAAELMTSELATNCLRHARSDFELAIRLSGDTIRVELSDHGEGQPELRSPTPRERSGRGLRIVQELSQDWGITPSPNGKIVWFTLPLRTPAAQHGSRSGASREKAPEQGREYERSHGAGAHVSGDGGMVRPIASHESEITARQTGALRAVRAAPRVRRPPAFRSGQRRASRGSRRAARIRGW